MRSSFSGTLSTESCFLMYKPCCYGDTTNTSTSLSMTTTTYGFDILHIATGYTLSTLMQLAQGGKSDVKVTIPQISFAWGAGVDASRSEGGLALSITPK